MAAEHEIRIWPEWFEDVASGKKPFEVRLNDRDYRAGDALLLREYDPNGLGSYTGRETRKVVTYVLDKPIVGLSPGYVVLGLVEPLSATAHPQEDAAAIREGQPAPRRRQGPPGFAAAMEDERCGEHSELSFICTRVSGHDGEHVARSDTGDVCERWPAAAPREQEKAAERGGDCTCGPYAYVGPNGIEHHDSCAISAAANQKGE